MRARIAAVTVAALAALALTSCSDPEPGPPGTVVGKDKDYECTGTAKTKSCHWEYELTTRATDGKQTEFEVTSKVYGRCYDGSSYPKCSEVDR